MNKMLKKIKKVNEAFYKGQAEKMPSILYAGKLEKKLLIDGNLITNKNLLGIATFSESLSEIQWLDAGNGAFMGQAIHTDSIESMIEYVQNVYGV